MSGKDLIGVIAVCLILSGNGTGLFAGIGVAPENQLVLNLIILHAAVIITDFIGVVAAEIRIVVDRRKVGKAEPGLLFVVRNPPFHTVFIRVEIGQPGRISGLDCIGDAIAFRALVALRIDKGGVAVVVVGAFVAVLGVKVIVIGFPDHVGARSQRKQRKQ